MQSLHYVKVTNEFFVHSIHFWKAVLQCRKCSYFYSVYCSNVLGFVFAIHNWRRYHATLPNTSKIQKCRSGILIVFCLFCIDWCIFIFHHTAVPTLEKVQSKMQTLPSPQWAHLDTEEFHQIASYSVQNPLLLFIRQYKFNDM